jgi:alcohol dehydrogenase
MRNCITIHGQWMYPREAITHMAGLIRSGLVSLNHDEVTTFGLDDVNAAVAHAAANTSPFNKTVLAI